MKSALVVGYGSIGKRHADVLARAGYTMSVVSRRPLAAVTRVASIAEALAARTPDLVVIATETSAHRAALAELDAARYGGSVLVEKPLWQPNDPPLAASAMRVSVGYVLRFHPVLAEMKRLLASVTVFEADIRCGSYLPDWRPGTDYRASESAKVAAGGGALRDLSHEIDYARWLLGDFERLAALGGRFGNLDIETDDSFKILAETSMCRSLAITVNYLDRPPSRTLTLNTDKGTYAGDLLLGTIMLNGIEIFRSGAFDRDIALAAQHADALAAQPSQVATLEDGARVVELIDTIEQAAKTRSWMATRT